MNAIGLVYVFSKQLDFDSTLFAGCRVDPDTIYTILKYQIATKISLSVLLFIMATVELDPQFIKALRLLRSKSKDSGAQLRAMLDEAIRLKTLKIMYLLKFD